ncbi:MAG: DUF308 domain-containing protein [Methanobrevibacter sp.]|nr:DUF308 domain-containing protein [Methanobrevibacter sp.]
MEKKMIMGILTVILGLVILVFPLMSQFVLSIIFGIGILILGMYLLAMGANSWNDSKVATIVYLILGFMAFMMGIMLLGNILLFDLLVGFYLYIIGFMLLFTGIMGLFTRSTTLIKGAAGLMALFGLLTLILGYFALLDPAYVSIILGITLIIDGISIAIGNYDGLMK